MGMVTYTYWFDLLVVQDPPVNPKANQLNVHGKD